MIFVFISVAQDSVDQGTISLVTIDAQILGNVFVCRGGADLTVLKVSLAVHAISV